MIFHYCQKSAFPFPRIRDFFCFVVFFCAMICKKPEDKAMTTENPGRLIILSGPSCVGKSPLDRALGRLYPDLRNVLQGLVLYNSRDPRPGETDGVDYYFRTEEQVKALASQERYVVMDVRGDIQALDLEELSTLLDKGDVFFEGNPFVGEALLTHPRLAAISKLSVFMAPLSREELVYLRECGVPLDGLITDVMRRKLLRRTRKQKGELSQKDLENIEKRASSTCEELKKAHQFDYVIPNHDGEDSENWDAFYYPLGDARSALLGFVALLRGKEPHNFEQWEQDLIT